MMASSSGAPLLVLMAALLIVFISSAASQGSTTGCVLNSTWRGNWFQSGLSTVRIDATSIDVKGKCLDNEGDYYLFEEKSENCYRCLFIASKHHNVLQYKESYCEERAPDESYQALRARLCDSILGDSPQYSLFRRDAAPVECPFRGSFTFTYSRGHGECRSPVSRLDSCTENSRAFFRYQACPDVQGTESSEEQLECLATWKEGSMRYMMGRVQHQGATSDEDRYRCFVYEKTQQSSSSSSNSASGGSAGGGSGGNSGSASGGSDRHRPTILLAQSGDASCNGLTSTTEGSRTLKLTKVEADGKGRGCRYPAWLLGHSHWQTLDGRWTYNFHKNNSTLRIANITQQLQQQQQQHGSSSSTPSSSSSHHSFTPGVDSRQEQKAVCQSVLDLGDNTARVVAHISQGCQMGYVCMVFYQRDAHVVEFQAGDSAPAPEDACTPHYFNPVPGHYTTLIASLHQTVSCPLDGKFSIVPSSSASARLPCTVDSVDANDVPIHTMNHFIAAGHRTSTIALGCSAPDTVDLYHECSRNPTSGYLCRSAWNDETDDRTKFVIVTPLHGSSTGGGSRGHEPQRRYCLTLTGSQGGGTAAAAAKALSMTSSPQQQQQQVVISSVGLNTQWEWIASSETCVRPYARDRMATHGQHSTHLSHNPHNLHITPAGWTGGSTVNVTWAGVNGQCTGMEAAITDSRKLQRSSSLSGGVAIASSTSHWAMLSSILAVLVSLAGR